MELRTYIGKSVFGLIALLCISSSGDDLFIDDYLSNQSTSDVQVALSNAIADANSGDRIVFTAGKEYRFSGTTVVDKSGLIFVGNGAKLVREDAIVTSLTNSANAGANRIQVADASQYRIGMEFAAVGATGGHADSETTARHLISGINGNEIEFRTVAGSGLTRNYDSGAKVVNTFDFMRIDSDDISFDGFVFDGNRSNNDTLVSWTRNRTIVSEEVGLTIENSIFKNMPSDGIVTSKSSGLNISNNLFRDLNTSAIHLSGTDNVDGNEIYFNNNVIFNSNNQWDRANHSEGAITISLRADHIRNKGNLVAESDAAFVGYFHHDMEDWVVEENMVTATDRLFYSTARIAEPLEDIIWRNNFANDVGDSFAITIEDGITDNFVFDNNEINGGTLRFTGLTDGSVFGNTVRSSDDDPLRLENLN
ncbi:MAG: hypothetical protein AAF623_09550, partial [Planctomycetota bacterium]